MHYRITHTTTYDYSEPVSLCQNLAHLTPRDVPGQRCRRTTLTIGPQPAVSSQRLDYFGNPATFFSIQESHRQLVLTAKHLVDVSRNAEPEPSRSPSWETVRERLANDRSAENLDIYQFVFGSYYASPTEELAKYARTSFTPGRPLLAAALDLTQRIHADFQYDPTATTISTPLQQLFSLRRGVCQDFAHLQIACLRSLGLAARYVSGYLRTVPPAGKERLIGADATHAWLSVYCPTNGWIDLDPTNNRIPSDEHILLACGRDYDDVCPVKGVILGGGQPKLTVTVDVATEVEG